MEFAAALPISGAGKILKRELRARLREPLAIPRGRESDLLEVEGVVADPELQASGGRFRCQQRQQRHIPYGRLPRDGWR